MGNFGSNIDPHIYHEIAETALNALVKNKYPGKLLRSCEPELCVKGLLRPLTEWLPTKTWRSNEQIVRRQFLTPPAIAYLLIYLLNLQENEIALASSAGTGSLASWASRFGLETHTNEINERRRKLLRFLGFNPTSFNAESINDFLPFEIIPDVLVMNPPFSSSSGRTANNSSKLGFQHVESALERLKKSGKFGIILGNSTGLNTKTGREFWRRMSGEKTRLNHNRSVSFAPDKIINISVENVESGIVAAKRLGIRLN
ncbi:MAG TPA: hypothetical protein VK308_01320 [Pyrinomonadaceae bacterium]|nr:hypothetical protein [Pyrinomonadaceae bacterium]